MAAGMTLTRNPQDTWTSDALRNENVHAIRQRVLNDPAYLASRDYIGDTPLQAAIAFGELGLVEFLLQHGADPNVAVDDGYTCLLTAIESEKPASLAIVKALVGAGASIHKTGINGWTPLHMAAARGHVEKARYLVQAGASIDERTEIDGGDTPLMVAASGGKPEFVQFLLDQGADSSVRNWISNRTAIEEAQYVASGPDPNVYSYLKDQNIRIEVEELFRDAEMSAEDLAVVKERMANFDMAENYFQIARKNVESGDHAKVICILSAHRTASPERDWTSLFRFCGSTFAPGKK